MLIKSIKWSVFFFIYNFNSERPSAPQQVPTSQELYTRKYYTTRNLKRKKRTKDTIYSKIILFGHPSHPFIYRAFNPIIEPHFSEDWKKLQNFTKCKSPSH